MGVPFSVTRSLFDEDRPTRTLVFLFVLSVGARLFFAWVVSPILLRYGIGLDLWPDSYHQFATNLVNGHGFAIRPGEPSVMRGPAYPVLGAFLFLVFGVKNLTPVQITHAILDGFTVIAIFFIGKRIFGRNVGVVASLLYAFYPLSIWYSTGMNMVSLLTLFYTCASLLIVRSFYGLSPRLSIGIGVLLGLTTLTLPITILLPFFLLGAWWLKYRNFCRIVTQFFLVFIVAALVICPWTIRNYRVSGHFVPVSLGGAYAFLFGDLFVEKFDGFSPYSNQYPGEYELQMLFNERITSFVEREGGNADFYYLDLDSETAILLNKYAMRTIADRPLHFVKKIAVQMATFWYLGNNRIKTLGILLIQLFYLIFWTFAGLYFCWVKREKGLLPLLLLIFYLNLAYAATIANARHGMPAMPLAVVIAAYGICSIASRMRQNKPA